MRQAMFAAYLFAIQISIYLQGRHIYQEEAIMLLSRNKIFKYASKQMKILRTLTF